MPRRVDRRRCCCDAGQDAVKIVDCYLNEGPKVLMRFGMALLMLVEQSRGGSHVFHDGAWVCPEDCPCFSGVVSRRAVGGTV